MGERPIEELLYDYIEGFLNAEDSAKLEEKIAADPELQNKLNRQRSFVKVLHRITGKISMSATEIAEQMNQVKEVLEDYRYTQKTTVYAREEKQVQKVELAYKKPDLHRLEKVAAHFAVGKMMEKEENLRLAEQLKRAGL